MPAGESAGDVAGDEVRPDEDCGPADSDSEPEEEGCVEPEVLPAGSETPEGWLFKNISFSFLLRFLKEYSSLEAADLLAAFLV